jgi:ribosome biogenesis GTPase / thiamine phosphate phosphatase
MDLQSLGWNKFFEDHFLSQKTEGVTVGRVAAEHKERYELYIEHSMVWAEVTGRFRYFTERRDDFPAVGGWVVIQLTVCDELALIHAVLPRKNKFSRKTAGIKTEEHIVAANVDTIFIVSGLDQDFNIRRLERYLTLTIESGAKPVILLNKADLCADVESKLCAVRSVARQAPVLVLTAIYDEGIDALRRMIDYAETASFLGSSGVGKSTIINHLLGKDLQKVQSVSGYLDKGRHTTTRRELIVLPDGGLLIDNPGMRELQLWSGEDSLAGAFEDIAELAANCRFRDCTHGIEPGCAVRQALEEGLLDARRFNNYLKMQREIKFLALRQDEGAARAEKLRWKKIKSSHKRNYKKK